MELRHRALQVLPADLIKKRLQPCPASAKALFDSRKARPARLRSAACRGAPSAPCCTTPSGPPLARHPEGRAVLIHAIAHIEFNAINLALDAIWRFDGMPPAVLPRLAAGGRRGGQALSAAARPPAPAHGQDYGDFPAHQGLWTMCEKTQHDIVARMALVPARWKRAAWTPRRRSRTSCAGGRPMRWRPRHSGHHPARGSGPCGHRQPLVPLAVRARGWTPSRTTPSWCGNTKRRACARRSMTARRRAGFTETELQWLQQG
jgi:uncharacterized ferritin-like protein (DUF455 family)